jgi:hypothetical protein
MATTHERVSGAQQSYLEYIREHPGCSIADVTRGAGLDGLLACVRRFTDVVRITRSKKSGSVLVEAVCPDPETALVLRDYLAENALSHTCQFAHDNHANVIAAGLGCSVFVNIL